jgi:hypothetical protein
MNTGDWVIAGEAKGALPKVGTVYEVRHSRKGQFALRVTRVDGEWLTGVVVEGAARAALSYNVRGKGEKITIRDSLTYLIPVDGATSKEE